jgi:thiamine biosynthesis lipoprotein ApbE
MGSQIELTAVGISDSLFDAATNYAKRFAEEWEDRFSRFRAHSELSRLNALAGTAMPVSTVFLSVLETALAAYERTGGLFDPSILPALAALGYDRDFRAIASRGSPAEPTSTPTGQAEQFVDPGAVTTATEDSGLAAAAGLSLEFDQTSQTPDQTAWSEDESDEDWDDEHEDDHDDEDDEHEDDDHDDD